MRTVMRNSFDVKSKIDRLWAERQKHVENMRAQFPTARILAAVATAHNVTVADLRRRDRSYPLSLARHHAVWEMRRRRLDLGFQQIAAELDRHDHTTALHSYQKFCRLVAAGKCKVERAAVAKKLGDRA